MKSGSQMLHGCYNRCESIDGMLRATDRWARGRPSGFADARTGDAATQRFIERPAWSRWNRGPLRRRRRRLSAMGDSVRHFERSWRRFLTRIRSNFHPPPRFVLCPSSFLGFTGFYWVSLGFNGFYWVLPGFTGFYWVLLGFTGFYWVSLSFTEFYWVARSSNGLYQVLSNFIEFY